MRAAIFDFDGTLCDSKELGLQIINALAQEFGFNPVRNAAEFRGLSTLERLSYLGISKPRVPFLLLEGRRRMRMAMDSLQSYPGVASCLARCREIKLYTAVLSSNSAQNVASFLRRECIAVNRIEGGIGLFGKKRKLEKLISSLGFHADQCVYIGDETRDIEAGRAAGMKTIGVSWGFSDRPVLKASNPTHVADSPEELFAILNQWR